MQAIILAAGMGKRLKNLTRDNTKCMLEVDHVKLIDRMLHQIEKYDVSRIVIVVGYKGENLKRYIQTLGIKIPVFFIDNDVYDKTNNIYSLALAKNYLLEEDTLLFESDLIFDDSVIDLLLSDERQNLALVDKYETWMDGTCVKIGNDDSIEMFVPKSLFNYDDIKNYYKTVNIYKFSRDFSNQYYVPLLDAYTQVLGKNEYYEQVLRVITMLDHSVIKAKRLEGQAWYEIDDIQDLDIANSIFCEDDEKVQMLTSRFGGYWRYPRLKDFCYLVNPYFPPKQLTDEIKASFEQLITSYPSGMHVNSLLAAKNFNVQEENIIIGNGAAEIIKYIMEGLEGLIGLIQPSFAEYINRCDPNNVVVFRPENRDFSYTCDDLIDFFSKKQIKSLVVVNPDNPSGNYLNRKDIMRLINWAEERSIFLIIDESFSDFADESGNTLLDEDILGNHTHFAVVKSISKSYGVPGLRLGIAASGDTEWIANLKRDSSIWNINSFAECYMQIEEKYKSDYENAIKQFKKERKRLFERLDSISGIRPIKSQANYIMAEVNAPISAAALTSTLLKKHNILIKDLRAKIPEGDYVRIAVRDRKDNDSLIAALKQELGER